MASKAHWASTQSIPVFVLSYDKSTALNLITTSYELLTVLTPSETVAAISPFWVYSKSTVSVVTLTACPLSCWYEQVKVSPQPSGKWIVTVFGNKPSSVKVGFSKTAVLTPSPNSYGVVCVPSPDTIFTFDFKYSAGL